MVDQRCEDICEAGWEWGCLAKVIKGGRAYYRLPENSFGDAVAVVAVAMAESSPDLIVKFKLNRDNDNKSSLRALKIRALLCG